MDETTLMKTDELINLEREVSEGNASPGALRRLERLKHKNEKDTLGLLAKALHSYEFRDDVLHTARLRDSKYLGECAKDPRWATVEVLDLGWNSLKRLGLTISDFLASMPLLHTLSLQADQVPERPCPGITTLNVSGELAIEIIAERFPGLTTLELDHVRRPSALWAHPFAEQLESITLGSLTWTGNVLRVRHAGSSSVQWIAQGPALRRLEVQEEELGHDRVWDLQELFDAARRRGAEVVLLPEAEPRSEWRSRHSERWH